MSNLIKRAQEAKAEEDLVADLFDEAISLLSGSASSMYQEAKKKIAEDGAYAILWYLTPAVLGVIWGPLGWAAWGVEIVMEIFGISISDVFGRAHEKTKTALDSGEPLTEEKIDEIVNFSVGEDIGVVSTGSLAYVLTRTITKTGFVKEAGVWGSFFRWFLKRGGVKMVGVLKGKALFTALLKWTLKKILWAAAGLAGVSAIVGKTKSTPPQGTEEVVPSVVEQTQEIRTPQVPRADKSKIAQFLTPTGSGTTTFINSIQRRWIVPLINSNIASTMIYWATVVYKEVEQRDVPIIMNSESFKQMVRVLLTNYDRAYPNYLEMPNNQQLSSPINSIKDVVDCFIWETADQIGKNQNA